MNVYDASLLVPNLVFMATVLTGDINRKKFIQIQGLPQT
jgi:hypothetical protein